MRAILFAGLLFWAAIPAPNARADEPTYDALVEDATKARAAGDLAQSLELLRRAFAIEPTPSLRHNIARLLEELGRYREAIDEYNAVSAHAAVDPALKAKDEAAIARLAPKLAHGWLVLAPPKSAVFESEGALLDGAPVDAPSREELRVAGGRHVLEIAAAREVAVLTLETPAGVRTTFPLDRALSSAETGELAISGAPGEITRISIDGYSIRAAADGHDLVRVAPGVHRVQIDVAGRPAIDMTRGVDKGSRIVISDWAPAAGAGAGPIAEKETSLGPFVTGGAGVAALAGGVALLFAASSGRAQIEDATRDERGFITGLTLAEADQIESRSATEAGAGVALTAVGSAAIAAALVWWLGFEE